MESNGFHNERRSVIHTHLSLKNRENDLTYVRDILQDMDNEIISEQSDKDRVYLMHHFFAAASTTCCSRNLQELFNRSFYDCIFILLRTHLPRDSNSRQTLIFTTFITKKDKKKKLFFGKKRKKTRKVVKRTAEMSRL